MPNDPQSPILMALYMRKPDEAERLAEALDTIWKRRRSGATNASLNWSGRIGASQTRGRPTGSRRSGWPRSSGTPRRARSSLMQAPTWARWRATR